ncbi:LOW QUALITY PROTEIN: uncharacterized protein LOC129221037 [Uloborus diversus]|uniref:LOW QUALITY PROTEIN: uncharacterized protein LOC129221037 n=1 Tax=Uloborus diversus TaxID=327109 RepID=UPI0024095E0E|nr:LOW QUALITY PROTEIN: uncharacterized protein LOC129221037 [Uloborus diversus]
MDVTQKDPPQPPEVRLLHFGCEYLLEAMVKRSFNILEQADSDSSFRKLEELCAEDPRCLEKALSDVLFAMDSGKLINFWKTIETQFVHYKRQRGPRSINEYVVPAKCRLIRRVTFTPTRTLLWPAELMCENRILRNFDSEYFLRVTFRDDDMLTMNFRRYDYRMFIETISSPMNSGLEIGSRKYQLLAWSSSQLREHGVSMYARDSKGFTASDIRNWVEISPNTTMNVPKCLARIGQCFSQTEETLRVPLDDKHVRVENDVEGGRNPFTLQPYCFTDGVGKISMKLANKVRKTLRHDKDCSAFQIRYSGFKGMLVIDPTLEDADIVFRRSMEKFCSRGDGHTKLEIAKPSSPSNVLEEMLKTLTDMLIDEEVARNYLNARTPFSDLKFNELSQSGVGLTAEPFFRTLLLALHRYYIDLVKTKANIDVDPSEGRNMFGVSDETGMLNYGEVFVQYSRDVTNNVTTPDDAIILTGPVMVTKCPCVHPGDVRKFTAVDVPALRHIVDCIVFPQRGPRPHPDEISGSDLDGDEYAVIWKKDLFFKGENNAPANYPKVSSSEFSNVHDFLAYSKTKDVVDFLIDYIKNDQIGSIASAHLAWADQGNIKDEKCIGIAAKHSVVVDFAKTGVSAHLSRDEVPKKWPDFMERFWKRRYRSKKSLGKLYRISKDFENENLHSSLHYPNIQIDPSLIVSGWETFEASANKSKSKYNNVLRTILQTYGIKHETEAFGGAFIKLHSRFRERRDRSEIVNIVHTWIKELIKVTKEDFMAEFGNAGGYLSVKDVTDNINRKASAWYVVTYREKSPEFLSFPWVVSDILSNVRIMRTDQIQNKESVFLHMPLVSKLENMIQMNLVNGQLRGLNREAKHFLNSWSFLVDRSFVETAIRVLTKWAQEERIISFSENMQEVLYYKTFLRIIFVVAELEGYAYKSEVGAIPKCSNPSSASLCLAFFKYCVKLRFCNKNQVRSIIGFDVYKDRTLSKRAMVTYHSIAVTGYFRTLCYEEFFDGCDELVEMKPLTITSNIFDGSPISESEFLNASSTLAKLSEVEEVYMRENSQTKKVIVTAFGSVSALRRLETLLRKDEMYLKLLFISDGDLPAAPPQILPEF